LRCAAGAQLCRRHALNDARDARFRPRDLEAADAFGGHGGGRDLAAADDAPSGRRRVSLDRLET
jgi:hypothetical protein